MRNHIVFPALAALAASALAQHGSHIGEIPMRGITTGHRRAHRRQVQRRSDRAASTHDLPTSDGSIYIPDDSLPTKASAAVATPVPTFHAGRAAQLNAAVPATSSAASDPSPQGISGLFVSSSPYFGVAVAVAALITFFGTLALIAVIRCCVKRHYVEDEQEPLVQHSPVSSMDSKGSRKSSVDEAFVASLPKRSSSHTVNGHLAPPPQYSPAPLVDPRRQQRRRSQDRVLPPAPQPAARPPYVDGPRGDFTQPRSAPMPPAFRSIPPRPSPLREYTSISCGSSEASAQPPRDRLAGLGRGLPPRQPQIEALSGRRGYERRAT